MKQVLITFWHEVCAFIIFKNNQKLIYDIISINIRKNIN